MDGRKTLLVLIALTEWFSLPTQFIVHLQNSTTTTPEAIMRFFGYFTILTNVLVCVWVTTLLMIGRSEKPSFFTRPSIQTAITLYILIVGLVYNIVLRNLWDSSPLQAILHDLLHTACPILTFIFWILYVDAKRVYFSNIPSWLIYPAVYSILTLIRGQFASWYPYPFLDLETIGIGQVALNAFILLIAFAGIAAILVLAGQRKSAIMK